MWIAHVGWTRRPFLYCSTRKLSSHALVPEHYDRGRLPGVRYFAHCRQGDGRLPGPPRIRRANKLDNWSGVSCWWLAESDQQRCVGSRRRADDHWTPPGLTLTGARRICPATAAKLARPVRWLVTLTRSSVQRAECPPRMTRAGAAAVGVRRRGLPRVAMENCEHREVGEREAAEL